jgi:hypothetical protein
VNCEYGWVAGTGLEHTPLIFIIAKKDSAPWGTAGKFWHNVIFTSWPPTKKLNNSILTYYHIPKNKKNI